MSPVGAALRRTRLSPNQLTAFGLVMAVPTAVMIGSGRLGIGLVLLIAAAVADLLDGALAKASGTASLRGAFFDSVSDRVTDALILGGFAWYLQSRYHGHAAVLPFAILAVSMLVSYERAKAESLGFAAKGGLMERGERIVMLCLGLAFSAALIPLLWAMLVLTSLTAVQRFRKVWGQAGRPITAPNGTRPSPTAGDASVPTAAAAAPTRSAPSSVPSTQPAGASHTSTYVPAGVPPAGARARGPGSASQGGPAEQRGAHAPDPPTPEPVDEAVDQPVAMADRWRAWLHAGEAGAGTPLSRRFSDGTRRRTSGRWQERRQVWRRAAQTGEGTGDSTGPRRRPGNRHP